MVSARQFKQRMKEKVSPIPIRFVPRLAPPPIRDSSEVYLQRRVRLVRSQTTVDPVTFTCSDLARALFHVPASGQTVQVKIVTVMGWNSTNSALSTNFIQLAPSTALATTEVDLGLYSDRGSGGLSAAVGIRFPESLVSFIAASNGSTAPLVTVQTKPPEATALINPQTLCLDMIVMVRY